MEPEGSVPHSQDPPPVPILSQIDPVGMSLFRCLGHTKVSTQVRGLLYEHFVTRYVITLRSCQHLAQPQSWRTTRFQLSVTAYLIYLQLPSILEAVPPSAT